MVTAMFKKTLIALSLLVIQQAQAAPVRDKHWALLANQLFPALVDLGAARPAEKAPAARRARIEACQQDLSLIHI